MNVDPEKHLEDTRLRVCIRELIRNGSYLVGSNSILNLAVSNEISGSKMFRCDTLINLGACLFGVCPIYNHRRVPAIKRDGVRGEAPPHKKDRNTVVPTSSDQDISKWTIPSHQSKRRRYSP